MDFYDYSFFSRKLSRGHTYLLLFYSFPLDSTLVHEGHEHCQVDVSGSSSV